MPTTKRHEPGALRIGRGDADHHDEDGEHHEGHWRLGEDLHDQPPVPAPAGMEFLPLTLL